MPDDANKAADDSQASAPQANVPQESVQDAEHFGEQNELPRQDKSEFWSGASDDGSALPETLPAAVDPDTADGAAPGMTGNVNATFGSLSGEGRPSSSATVDPDTKSESEG